MNTIQEAERVTDPSPTEVIMTPEETARALQECRFNKDRADAAWIELAMRDHPALLERCADDPTSLDRRNALDALDAKIKALTTERKILDIRFERAEKAHAAAMLSVKLGELEAMRLDAIRYYGLLREQYFDPLHEIALDLATREKIKSDLCLEQHAVVRRAAELAKEIGVPNPCFKIDPDVVRVAVNRSLGTKFVGWRDRGEFVSPIAIEPIAEPYLWNGQGQRQVHPSLKDEGQFDDALRIIDIFAKTKETT